MLSAGRKVLTGESEVLGEKFVPVPLCPHSHFDLIGVEPGPPLWRPLTKCLNHGNSYARFVIFKRVLMISGTERHDTILIGK